MKKIYYPLIFILLLIIIFFVFLAIRSDEDTWVCQGGRWFKFGNRAKTIPPMPCTSRAINSNQNTGITNPASTNCLDKGGKLEIKDTDAGQIGICTFTDGSKCEEWTFFRGDCQIGSKIVVYSPTKNQEVSWPIVILGEARGNWFFEASFPIKLLDAKNQLIGQAIAQAKGDWMTTEFVPFEATIEGSILSQSGKLPVTLVLQRDNPSGLPQNDEQIIIPLTLNQPETIKIKIYFGNSKFNPGAEDCQKVFAVERVVQKTESIGRAALNELLKGPTEEEKSQGYFTSINPGVTVQSLNIKDGLAQADFDETLQSQVGGSCRVAAINSQINETLKQFPTVKRVVVSVNGRTEDILQP